MTAVFEAAKPHSYRPAATLPPTGPPVSLITRRLYDLSSVNHATITPLLTPHLSQLLRSPESASAARTQCPGVDRVHLGPGRLTLLDAQV